METVLARATQRVSSSRSRIGRRSITCGFRYLQESHYTPPSAEASRTDPRREPQWISSPNWRKTGENLRPRHARQSDLDALLHQRIATQNRGELPDSLWKHSIGRSHDHPSPPGDRVRRDDMSAAYIALSIDGQPHTYSPLLLRDLCECPRCVDPSTKQKLFSTADIPKDIHADEVTETESSISFSWMHDVPGYELDHTTELSLDVLRSLVSTGAITTPVQPKPRIFWKASMFNQLADIDYDAYMQDDAVLYQALQQLHKYGLLFVSNVPESENSVSTLGERIGPIKNTFYGYTWDVRSVPEAKNVAYTSQDLGFHMDLLYMQQPPHLQLLHCIRSSAKGGASLFTDSFRAARDLLRADFQAFSDLAALDTMFHYHHPSSHLYQQLRTVLEMKPLKLRGNTLRNVATFAKAWESHGIRGQPDYMSLLSSVAWSPPFQGPFGRYRKLVKPSDAKDLPYLAGVNARLEKWHAAAQQFSALVHEPRGIYERLMRPGECVIFDNRRVLHARKAFEPGDAGSERWLRGAYLDKDPYESKMDVLRRRFSTNEAADVE